MFLLIDILMMRSVDNNKTILRGNLSEKQKVVDGCAGLYQPEGEFLLFWGPATYLIEFYLIQIEAIRYEGITCSR